MVHSGHMVVVVAVKGGILREDRDPDGTNRVFLPFGSDYSLRFKNLDSRKAVINVSIDGTDVLNGNQLVVFGNSVVDLDGWMDGTTVKHAFRFTQKTKQIIEHRGDKIDDGIIRIAWKYEKPAPEVKVVKEVIHHHHTNQYWPGWPQRDMIFGSTTIGCRADNSRTMKSCARSSSIRGSSVGGQSAGPAMDACAFSEPVASCKVFEEKTLGFAPTPAAEEGITVRGADRNQRFREITVGELEEVEHVVCIKLFGGDAASKTVEQPILTRKDVVCDVCGKKHRSDNKFCSSCGNALR